MHSDMHKNNCRMHRILPQRKPNVVEELKTGVSTIDISHDFTLMLEVFKVTREGRDEQQENVVIERTRRRKRKGSFVRVCGGKIRLEVDELDESNKREKEE